MSKAETMRQSADAANAQSLTDKARQLLQETQDLLEQVKQRAKPLTAEDLENRIEPLLSALVMVAQMDVTQLEQATKHAGEVARESKELRYDLQRASEEAQEAARTWRGSVLAQAGWLMVLSALSGLIGALLIVGFLHWGGGLKPSSVTVDYRDLQEWLQGQLCVMPKRDVMPPRQQQHQPQQQRR